MPRGALKSSLLLAGTLGLTEPSAEAATVPCARVSAPPGKEAAAALARTWAEAWHRGDREAMRACLHPDLGALLLENAGGRTPGLEAPQEGLGPAVAPERRRTEVSVLDIQGRSASVRVDLGPWVAFLHLAAHRGGWAVASALWAWS